MKILKKLTFIPFLLVSVIACVLLLNTLLQDPMGSVFSFQLSILKMYGYLCASILLSGLFFALIVTLSGSWEIPLLVAGICGIVPLMMLQTAPINIIVGGGFFVGFIIEMVLLLQKLKSYLTFQPNQLLSPAIGWATFILITTVSVVFYQAVEAKILKDGFSVPDQLIDMALSLSGAGGSGDSLSTASSNNQRSVKGVSTATAADSSLSITPEQIEMLKKNPQLLKQFNITPEQFDEAVKYMNQPSSSSPKPAAKGTPTAPQSTSKGAAGGEQLDTSGAMPGMIKDLVKTQLNEAVKPYASFIAPLIASLVFSLLVTINFVLGLFMPFLIWIIFSTFEKVGFVHFEKEMREVRKLVV